MLSGLYPIAASLKQAVVEAKAGFSKSIADSANTIMSISATLCKIKEYDKIQTYYLGYSEGCSNKYSKNTSRESPLAQKYSRNTPRSSFGEFFE